MSYRASLDDTEERDMKRLINPVMVKLISIRYHYMVMDDLAAFRGIESLLGRAPDARSQ
jgi:hypothetical protein